MLVINVPVTVVLDSRQSWWYQVIIWPDSWILIFLDVTSELKNPFCDEMMTTYYSTEDLSGFKVTWKPSPAIVWKSLVTKPAQQEGTQSTCFCYTEFMRPALGNWITINSI